MKTKVLLVVLALAACARADESGSENVLDTVFTLLKDCNGDYSVCIKEKVLKIVDNVRSAKSLTLVKGVTLKADPEKRSAKSAEPLPTDPELRDTELNYRIVDGIVGMAETHSLEVNLADSESADGIKRSLEEGRKKKKGDNGLGMLAMLVMLKLGLKKLLLIKLLALKALVVGKIGLALAVILLIHHLLNQGHTKTTYEVVPHAHHSHESHHEISHHPHESHHEISHHPHVEYAHASHDDHGHFASHAEPHFSGGGYGGGDWSKSVDDGHNLAYGGYSGHSRK